MDHECRLQLGEFCCALMFPGADPAYVASVQEYFRGFITDQAPDILVTIDIILHDYAVPVPTSLCVSKRVDGNSFDYNDGLIKGKLDLSAGSCSIQVKRALLGNPTVRIFEQFFHQLYYTLLEHRYHGDINTSLLLHSCGVLRHGRGYLFTGPSGGGKTTVAQLSSEYDVLNDEMCFINRAGNRYQIRSTPFNGFFRSKRNTTAPLSGIFFLKQDERNYIQKAVTPACLVALAREIVPPISLLSQGKKHPLSQMVDLAARVLADVPSYELHFLPDKRFWELIDELDI